MPRYTPQSLPMDASRPAANDRPQPDNRRANTPATPPYVQLAQHIRRERGMQGVRGYVASMRNYLTTNEYQQLCQAMGVPLDVQPTEPTHAQQSAKEQTPPQPPPPPQNAANQAQMLQTLMQLMNAQGGSSAGAGGGLNPNLLTSLLGGGQGGGQGGINPALLAQLLNGMNTGK